LVVGLSALVLVAAETAEVYLGKGYEALRQERYEAAVSEFRAALRLDPKLVMRARFPLGVALFLLKQTDQARREFEAVRRDAGDQPNVAYYLGRLDLLDGDFAGAARNLRKAASRPPFPDTAYYLGCAYLKHGDFAEAEKWLERAVETNPRDSLAEYQLGTLYRRLGRAEEARKALARSADLRRQDTNESQLRTDCGRKLETGPRAEARAFCWQLYDPNSAERLAALGTIYGQHGDLEDALEPFQRAVELAPQSPQMQYNLAYTYFQMGRFEEARIPLAKAVERWPDLLPLNALYGAVLAKLGEDVAAYRALGRAHELNPEDAAVSQSLSQIALLLARSSQAARRYDEALRYFGEAARLRPADPEPHRGLAQVYAATGHGAEAAAEQKRAAGDH
jgi:Flp pilus assembly protein TadD